MNKNKILFILRIVLALVFLISAFTKIIAPGIIEIILTGQGIISSRETAALFVRILIGLEFALGLLLLQKNFLKRIVLPCVFLFLSAFTIYLLYTAVILKETQNCGCFGAAVQMSPVESIIKNIILLAVAVYLFRNIKEDGKKIILPLILFAIALPAVFVISPVKNYKDFVFSKYTYFEGTGRTDLEEGEKIVLIMSLECEHCQKAAGEIAELEKSIHFPRIYTLFFAEGNVTPEIFKAKTGFSSPYKIIKGEEFFDLIGSQPPRLYRLVNGKIAEYWDKDIPENLKRVYQK